MKFRSLFPHILAFATVTTGFAFPQAAGAAQKAHFARPSLGDAVDRITTAADHVDAIRLTTAHTEICTVKISPKIAFVASNNASCAGGHLQIDLALSANSTSNAKTFNVSVALNGKGGTTDRSFSLDQMGVATQAKTTTSKPAAPSNAGSSTTSASAPTATVTSVNTTGSSGVGSGSSGPSQGTASAAECPATASSTGGTTPVSVGYCDGVDFSDYGNLTWGDCTLATVGDLEQAFNSEIGQSSGALSSDALIGLYQQISGATSANPDPAISNNTAIDQWEQGGVAGTIVNAWTQLNVSNDAGIENAVWQLGGLYTNVALPDADTSSTGGTTWNLTTTPPGSPTSETHAMALVGYDAANVYFVAWGHLQAATWAWWNTYANLAIGVLPAQFVAAGSGPTLPVTELESIYFS